MYRIIEKSDMQPAEIMFITEVEKRPCLYNNSLTEYNRKDVTDDAWKQVGEVNGLSIGDCKEKWRNIRSSFLRSLKLNGQKTKKPYYLSEYLTFVMPFMKPLNNSIKVDSTDGQQGDMEQRNAIDKTNLDPLLDAIKIETDINYDEAAPEHYDEGNEGNIEGTESQAVHHTQLMISSSSSSRKRRRSGNVPKVTSTMKYKSKRYDTESSQNRLSNSSGRNVNSMRLFLMSLLPEFDSMNEDQVRMFKIKVMMLIDDIKGNYSEMRQNLQLSNNNERLQKRLINLLLKNLQRNT